MPGTKRFVQRNLEPRAIQLVPLGPIPAREPETADMLRLRKCWIELVQGIDYGKAPSRNLPVSDGSDGPLSLAVVRETFFLFSPVSHSCSADALS